MKKGLSLITVILFVTAVMPMVSAAKEKDSIIPIAIMGFEERGAGLKGYGNKVRDIFFAKLVSDPRIYLVERSEIENILSEQEMMLSGVVSPSQAIQVGQLTGAKILIGGSIIEVDKRLYLVAKLVGTETSRILGESIKGHESDEIGPLAESLADKVLASLHAKADTIVAPQDQAQDQIAVLQKSLGNAKRPLVAISIAERHIGQPTIDPAAETEMLRICQLTGFETIDTQSGAAKKADIQITGEGFSEFAGRRGNIVSVKARLEVKAVDRATQKLVAADRCTVVEIDLAEHIAGKTALQKAAAVIAQRMLPKLVGN